MTATFAAGMALGIAGSLHCAGMCGPILVTVNRIGLVPRRDMWTRMLLYHAARVLMYVGAGVAAGYTGMAFSTAGLGRTLAIVSGGLLVIAAVGTAIGRSWDPFPPAWSSAVVRAGVSASRALRTHPRAGALLLGGANALLPCGLLYAAILTAAALGSVTEAVLFMSGFGLGTVPLLIGVSVSALSLPAGLKRRLRFAIPVVIALTGTLLVARGVLPSEPGGHHHHVPILSLQH